VNIDGGGTVDPETGLLYVAAQTGLSTAELNKDPCSEFRYSSTHDSCGQLGALPPPPGYVKGGGREGGGRGGFASRGGGSAIGGVSIVKPKELGGITAYNMSTGDKAWWIPNGGQLLPVESKDPLFEGVKLPPAAPGRGHAQVITTKTLVIYGTGRAGGPPSPPAKPQLFAVDKASGKQVGAVGIPSRTSAVPMTFMHKGKQYIVFATGAGGNTSLVALTLPKP
jgi:quinoprotein glucose dehydrogenase